MINYLKGCTEQTQIGMLPDIITHNNNAIKNEFEYIYDSSLNRLIKSVYAPTGSVKAHFGEFVNLAVEYISIKNIDSLSETIQKAVSKEQHNIFQGRFDSSDAELQFMNTNFCHNASIIAYNASYNVYQQITSNIRKIADLSTYIELSICPIVDDASAKAAKASHDVHDLSIYVHSIQQTIDDVSKAAWMAKHDTDDISIYVHGIEVKIDDISAKAYIAYNYSKDLSVYVHGIQAKIDNISIKVDDAYNHVQDLSIYVYNEILSSILDVSKVACDASTTAHKALTLAQNVSAAMDDVSAVAYDAQDMAINNMTVISKLASSINTSINIIDTSINGIKTNLADISNNVDILKNDMTSVQSAVQVLDLSVANISINIDNMQVQVDNVSTQIDNIKTANFQITYNSSTYELSDIVKLIDWKNSLTTEVITVQSGGQLKTLNVLCLNNLASTVIMSNAGLNQLTGETSSIDNPEEYTPQDINDAATQMGNLL